MVLKRLPELLAPAGSPEALRAAVAAGADAVYLSGKRFGARKFAVNFGEHEMKGAIDYAHLRGVRVYVTVNTLVREDELSDVARYLLSLYEMGADAVLVQDLGVIALARQIVPGLELHASTQMTIHNRQGVAWAARQGLKRVVLAREVSLEEIRGMEGYTDGDKEREGDVTKGPSAGIEVFVHGALCYCYSGQCLMSAAIGGRSGNRGMCAQPCRKPYVLLKGGKDEYGRPLNLQAVSLKEKFLISTRDLSVYEQLDKVVSSPVESIKIEGRMKSSEYVAIVTNIYRRALDGIAKGAREWKPSREDVQELALAFNRDFTVGYLLGSKEIMGREMSDNRGVLIGTVTSFDSKRDEAAVKLTGPLVPEQGDGLVILSPGQEVGMVAYRPLLKDGLLRLRVPERVRTGARVYMTSSTALSRKAKKIASAQRRIPIDLQVSWDDGTPVANVGLENDGQIEVRAGFKMEKALSRPLTKEQIEGQLSKTGGTPFHIRKLVIGYPGGLFAPISVLNRFRRDILENVEDALISVHRPPPENILSAKERLKSLRLETSATPSATPSASPSASSSANMQRRIPSLAVYCDSLDAVKGAIDGGCMRVYFEPRAGRGLGQKEYAQRVLELLKEAKDVCTGHTDSNLVWKWPRVTRDGFLKLAVPMLPKAAADGIMVEGMGAAEAIASAMPRMRLSGSMSLNIWNHLTVWQLTQFRRLTLSPELSANQLSELIAKAREISVPELELIVQGNIEAMVTEDCLPCLSREKADFWGLQDFKRIFPLYLDDDSRTHIQNSVETCLIDHMPRLFQIGLDGLAVDARSRTEKYAREMTELYLRAIEMTEKRAASLEKDLAALKDEARIRSLGGITTGHFLKGLKE
jgi:putative protease